MKRRLAFFAVLALAVATGACEKRETAPPEPRTEAPQTSSAPASSDTAPGAQTQETADTNAGYLIDMAAGERVYQQSCVTCHGEGIAGAPRTGNKESWEARIAQGMETLISHSIEGYQGNQGVMPPKGGMPNLSDEEVASAVAYMVEQSR